MRIHAPQMTANAIDKALEQNSKDSMRDYIGMSSIGTECERAIWLSFHWVVREPLTGRMIRLLARGQREEIEIINYLKSVGVNVTEYGENQREVRLGQWMKGHCDGIIISGLLESPKKMHILEIKTSNLKAFEELKKKGVKFAKPMHYAQMQCYMYATGIDRAFYFCVCKDNDEVYTERIDLDVQEAERLMTKGERIATEKTIPPRISNLPTWYECKLCKYYDFCHGNAEIQEHCRTCEHIVFNKDGKAVCSLDNHVLTSDEQKKKYDCYKRNFDLCR